MSRRRARTGRVQRSLAESIVAEQTAEIEALQTMLEALGLEREPESPPMSPGHSPAPPP